MQRRRERSNRLMMRAAGCCAALVLAASAAVQAAPKALNEAPKGVDAVLVVPNLAQLSRDLAAVKQSLGLPVPQLDDALTEFKKSSGMVKGFNDQGSLLVVLPDLAAALNAHRQPEFVLLVPVSDYQAFLNNFKSGQTDQTEQAEQADQPDQTEPTANGVTAITMSNGDSGFAKHVDDYAVLGKDKTMVANFQPGHAADQIAQNIGDAGQPYLASSDVMLYVNLEKVGPALTPMLEQGFKQAQDKLEHAPTETKQMLASEKDFAKGLLKQTTGLLLGLDVDKQGIGLTYAVGYKPDSKIAQMLPGREHGASTGAVSLKQLPQQPFILALFMDTKAIDLAKLDKFATDLLPAKMTAQLHDVIQQRIALLKQTQSIVAAIYPPAQNAMMGGGLLNILAIVQTPNAQNYVQGVKQFLESINGKSMEMPGVPGADAAQTPEAAPQADSDKPASSALTYHASYQSNVLQLDGTQVDQYQYHMTMPPQMMQRMGPMAALMNYSGYVAAKDGKVVITTTANPQLVTQGFQAMQTKDGIGTMPALEKLPNGALPADPAIKAFISFKGIAQAANTFTQMMGMPAIQAPADLPPFAVGLGIQGHSLASRLYMPMDTLKFIVTTAQDFKQKMSGPQAGPPAGPGNGQPGGPPPF